MERVERALLSGPAALSRAERAEMLRQASLRGEIMWRELYARVEVVGVDLDPAVLEAAVVGEVDRRRVREPEVPLALVTGEDDGCHRREDLSHVQLHRDAAEATVVIDPRLERDLERQQLFGDLALAGLPIRGRSRPRWTGSVTAGAC